MEIAYYVWTSLDIIWGMTVKAKVKIPIWADLVFPTSPLKTPVLLSTDVCFRD